MIIFKNSDRLSQYLIAQKNDGKSVGFVPTMGALHPGHLALVKTAQKENDLVACSIFINPTQFNNPDDFTHYPVTVEKDLELLIEAGADVVFMPSVEEIYPPGYVKKQYDLGDIETVLEGHYRPGHFQGVCQVVDRLLALLQPNQLYLGQKDFQQCMVIKRLVQLTGLEEKINIRIIPTFREPDGLAMSSRNLRLNPEQRQKAPSLYRELNDIKEHLHTASFGRLKSTAKEHLEKNGFLVDYIEIANQQDLSPATTNSTPLVALVAASLGNIRLIDNLLLNEPSVPQAS
jgi:pantoate--beta-alanine ligase